MSCTVDVSVWANEQFGRCKLGDSRRTARVVTIATQFAANPSGSIPDQTETWKDCKAAYRLLDNKRVTFAALGSPNWKQTTAKVSGHFLILGDTTTIRFDKGRQVEGMGITTSDKHQGFLLHSALVVNAETGQIEGLGGQTIYYRKRVRSGESFRDRLRRDRESKVWGEVIKMVGPPNPGVRFTHVFDRGADNFEVFCHLLLQKCDWVIRVAQTKRLVSHGNQKLRLNEYLQTLPVAGTYKLTIQANQKQTARRARVEVRYGSIGLAAPRDCGKFVKECGIAYLTMHVVEVREIACPTGHEPLHWILYTSHPVNSFDDAGQVIGYHEQRPLVEEFHKALKTGCRLEERQFVTAARWERLTAILSIRAVRLLQMKTIARQTPDLPAEEVVPSAGCESYRSYGTVLRSRFTPSETSCGTSRHWEGI